MSELGGDGQACANCARVYVAKSSLEGVWVLSIVDVRVGLDNVEMIIWPVVANAHVVLVMPCAMNSW